MNFILFLIELAGLLVKLALSFLVMPFAILGLGFSLIYLYLWDRWVKFNERPHQ